MAHGPASVQLELWGEPIDFRPQKKNNIIILTLRFMVIDPSKIGELL